MQRGVRRKPAVKMNEFCNQTATGGIASEAFSGCVDH
jgi:hypothetical protein